MIHHLDPIDDWGNRPSIQWNSRKLHIDKDNRLIYLIGSSALAATTLSSIIGIIALSAFDKDIPQALIVIASLATGALGNLFTLHR